MKGVKRYQATEKSEHWAHQLVWLKSWNDISKCSNWFVGIKCSKQTLTAPRGFVLSAVNNPEIPQLCQTSCSHTIPSCCQMAHNTSHWVILWSSRVQLVHLFLSSHSWTTDVFLEVLLDAWNGNIMAVWECPAISSASLSSADVWKQFPGHNDREKALWVARIAPRYTHGGRNVLLHSLGTWDNLSLSLQVCSALASSYWCSSLHWDAM